MTNPMFELQKIRTKLFSLGWRNDQSGGKMITICNNIINTDWGVIQINKQYAKDVLSYMEELQETHSKTDKVNLYNKAYYWLLSEIDGSIRRGTSV